MHFGSQYEMELEYMNAWGKDNVSMDTDSGSG